MVIDTSDRQQAGSYRLIFLCLTDRHHRFRRAPQSRL